MKWVTAVAFGAIVGFVLPTAVDAGSGLWTGWGAVRPLAGSPGLLLSLPLFLGSAAGLRLAFNWHTR